MRRPALACLAPLAVAFCLVLVAGTADAGPILVTFTGKINNIDPALSSQFDTTQTLSGSYLFDPTVAARSGSDSSYAVFDALQSLDFSIGSYSASSLASAEIQVDNAPTAPNDRYGLVSRASEGLTGPDVAGLALDGFAFRLDDSTNTVFSNALDLPTSLSLSDFNSSAFFVFFVDPNDASQVYLVDGELTSLQFNPVPEPGTLTLAGIGLGGLLLASARARRSAGNRAT